MNNPLACTNADQWTFQPPKPGRPRATDAIDWIVMIPPPLPLPSQRSGRSSWDVVVCCLAATISGCFLQVGLIAAGSRGRLSFVGVLGVVLVVAAVGVCFWLFLRCPRRPLLPKLICLALFLLGRQAAVDFFWRVNLGYSVEAQPPTASPQLSVMRVDSVTAMILVTGLMAVTLLGSLAVVGLVIRDTRRRHGRWGINSGEVHCPRCHTLMPRIRTPLTFYLALWGAERAGIAVAKWTNGGRNAKRIRSRQRRGIPNRESQ